MENAGAKKARPSKNVPDYGWPWHITNCDNLLTAKSGSEDSDYGDESSPTCIDTDRDIESRAVTPLTPISSKASPRHPSDLIKSHQCPYSGCNKAFNRPAKLMQHLRSHTNTRPFVCPHEPCVKDFLRESHLKHHIKSAHSDIRDYVCGIEGCSKSFITATRLRRHEATHAGKEQFKCQAANCGQTFRKHATLQRHVTVVHEGKEPYVCVVVDEGGLECGAGFETEGKLKSHIGRLHGAKRFMCTICSATNNDNDIGLFREQCGASFPTHAALQAHLISEHPPTCAECGLQCTSQSALKSHAEVVHGDFDVNERRIYICQETSCGRGFTKRGNLNAHAEITHGGKRFICGEVDPKTLNNIGDWDGSEACGEALKSKANLEKHIRGVHLGLKASSKMKKKEGHGGGGKPIPTGWVSTLAKLTGAGCKADSGRVIPCLFQDCILRFTRQYDLEIHLQSQHGLVDLEIQQLLMERDFYSGSESQTYSNWTATQISEALKDHVFQQDKTDAAFNSTELPERMDLPDEAASWFEPYSISFSVTTSPHSRCCMVQGGDVDMIDPDLV